MDFGRLPNNYLVYSFPVSGTLLINFAGNQQPHMTDTHTHLVELLQHEAVVGRWVPFYEALTPN